MMTTRHFIVGYALERVPIHVSVRQTRLPLPRVLARGSHGAWPQRGTAGLVCFNKSFTKMDERRLGSVLPWPTARTPEGSEKFVHKNQ